MNADGDRPGILRALLRTLCWVVDILPGIPLVAYGVAGQSHRHQRIGDHLARTYVVDKHAVGIAVGTPIELDDPFADHELVVEAAPPPDDAEGDASIDPVPVSTPTPEPDEAERVPVAAAATTTTAAVAPAPAPHPQPLDPPEGVPVDEPIWDRRHRRYVMWHGRSGRWLEHAHDGWRPLDS